MPELTLVELEYLPDLFKLSRIYKTCHTISNTLTLFSNVCHYSLTMNSYRDLCRTMDTLRYWQFNQTPHLVYENVSGNELIIREIFSNNCGDLFLRYQTFYPLLEIGILAFGKTVQEKKEMANYHELQNLFDYLQYRIIPSLSFLFGSFCVCTFFYL